MDTLGLNKLAAAALMPRQGHMDTPDFVWETSSEPVDMRCTSDRNSVDSSCFDMKGLVNSHTLALSVWSDRIGHTANLQVWCTSSLVAPCHLLTLMIQFHALVNSSHQTRCASVTTLKRSLGVVVQWHGYR